MTHVSKDLQARVITRLNECIAIAEGKFNQKFAFPAITYHKRGTTAGTANCHRWVLDFNPTLFVENVDDFLHRTVAHEMAHLIDYQVYQKRTDQMGGAWAHFSRTGRRQKRSVHGPTWQSIMRLLGAPVSRCHSYDVTNAQVKKRTRYNYACACGQVFELGPKHHAAVMRGEKITHRTCRTVLTKDHYKPITAVARPVSVAMAADASPPPAPRAGSKLDQAMTIVATHGGYNREQLIDLIRRDTGMSRAGAQTYYYSAKKRLELEKKAA